MKLLSVNFFLFFIIFAIAIFVVNKWCKNGKTQLLARNIIVVLFSAFVIYQSGRYAFLFYAGYVVLVYVLGLLANTRRIPLPLLVLFSAIPLLGLKFVCGAFWDNVFFPIGVSYVTFKAIGYIYDIHKQKTDCEKNLLVLASFLIFFPEIFIGPIDRSDSLLIQLRDDKPQPGIDWDIFLESINLILWGMFQKMVIADRMGVYVDDVYNNLYRYDGLEVFIGVLIYSAQIYFDFAGCTYIVLGIGKLAGFEMPKNFERPYLATSVVDFWRRWHISLTRWLRDYIYIPLGGNRKGNLRKYLNILIVFAISGIWHGSGITFLIWGLLNGIYQIIGMKLFKMREKLWNYAGFMTNSHLVTWIRRIGVYIAMTSAWIFFRSKNLSQAILVFKKILTKFNLSPLFDGTIYNHGLTQRNWCVMIISVMVVFVANVLEERGMKWQQWYRSRHFVVKGMIWYILIISIMVFGIYGSGYDATNFIYENF